MIKKAAFTNFRFRWMHAGLWLLFFSVYLGWLFAPITSGGPVAWWPDEFVHYAFWGMTYKDWLYMGKDGLDGLFGFRGRLLGRGLVHGIVAVGHLCMFSVFGWIFLSPGGRWLAKLPARRKPTIITVLVTGLMWALLATAALALLLDITETWDWFIEDLVYFIINGKAPTWMSPARPTGWPNVVALCIAWLAAVMVLDMVWRKQQRFWQFERMTLYLLIVSIVLLLLPLIGDALNWGRDDDWYTTHSGRYTTRILAATVLFWAWACRSILLFQLMRFEKQAKETPDQECFACGYDLRGTLEASRKNCPECGAAIAIEMLQEVKE